LVEVWLPYGKTEVCVRIPTQSLLKTIEPNNVGAAKNPQSELESSLANPIGTKRLSEISKPGSKVALVLRDSDTSTNTMIVSALLNELNYIEARDENVTVIVACDPLRDHQTWQQMPTLGESISSKIKVVRHDPKGMEHVKVGQTSRGTVVFLNKAFVEADVKIVAGAIEPHPLAGYSSGVELVLPGVSGVESIRKNFLLALNKKVERGNIEGNPVYEDMVEAAGLARVDFCLNVVRNSGLEVVKAFAGDAEGSFGEAVKVVKGVCSVPVDSRADIVFVSPGGFPFDGSLFESLKCLDVAEELVKKGKSVVLVAECAHGLGDREFVEAASRHDDPKAVEKELKRNISVGKLVAYRFLTAVQNARLFLVSVVPDYLITQVYGVKSARTANDAYHYASDTAGKNGKVAFVPYGNLILPQIKTAE
jgi:nickel-dependent lactate racemase